MFGKGKDEVMKKTVVFVAIAFVAVVLTAYGNPGDANAEYSSGLAGKDAAAEEVDTVRIKAGEQVLAVIGEWDPELWFFTSRKQPLRTLEGLTRDEIACWGGELFQNVLDFREAIGIPTDNKNLGVHVVGLGQKKKIEELIPYGLDKPVRLFITWSSLAPRLEGVVKVEFVADNARRPETGKPISPFTVTGPGGRSVLAADERTKEFLEKAFKAGFLFPDPSFPGNVTFDMQAFISSDGDGIIKQYFPGGKLEMRDIDEAEERVVLSLISPPLKTEQAEENRKGSVETVLARGEILFLQGSSEEAYAAFEEALNISVDVETKARAMVKRRRIPPDRSSTESPPRDRRSKKSSTSSARRFAISRPSPK